MIQHQHSYRETTAGALYLVPTPIGNLDDMTFRAVKILQEADIILAEDTRHTVKLLNHFDIQNTMHSYHEHSNEHEAEHWITQLEAGRNIALVSDAGMPLINDPGQPLVTKAIAADISVIALPGANAALTALVASGLPSERFTYYGFFPRVGKEQTEILELLGQRDETALFYESPYRIKQTLKQVVSVLGPEAPVVIGRELTKRYEEYIRGHAQEVYDYLQENPLKGEFVLIIEGGQIEAQSQAEYDTLSYRDHVELLMANKGITAKEAIKEVTKIRQVSKKIVYNDYHNIN